MDQVVRDLTVFNSEIMERHMANWKTDFNFYLLIPSSCKWEMGCEFLSHSNKTIQKRIWAISQKNISKTGRLNKPQPLCVLRTPFKERLPRAIRGTIPDGWMLSISLEASCIFLFFKKLLCSCKITATTKARRKVKLKSRLCFQDKKSGEAWQWAPRPRPPPPRLMGFQDATATVQHSGPRGNTSQPLSGKMPSKGYHTDTLILQTLMENRFYFLKLRQLTPNLTLLQRARLFNKYSVYSHFTSWCV